MKVQVLDKKFTGQELPVFNLVVENDEEIKLLNSFAEPFLKSDKSFVPQVKSLGMVDGKVTEFSFGWNRLSFEERISKIEDKLDNLKGVPFILERIATLLLKL